MNYVRFKVASDLVSVEDGLCHTVESFGEALDERDKTTTKAMSAAYKSAMLQAFCIPVVGEEMLIAASSSCGKAAIPHQSKIGASGARTLSE